MGEVVTNPLTKPVTTSGQNSVVYFYPFTNIFFFIFLQVVLAANDLPCINDVTYPELLEIISKVIKTFIDVLLGIHLFANAC